MTPTDAAAATDQLRRHDTLAITAAFRRIPPTALLVIMDIAGLTKRRAPDLGLELNGYENGMQALAIEILTRAGFDSASILAAAITGSLEGEQRHEHPGSGGGAILDGGYEPNGEY